MTESEDLRRGIASLNTTVASLQVAVAVLTTRLAEYALRDIEDHQVAVDQSRRLGAIENWRSRIQGQIALAYFLIGVVAALIGARLAHLIP